MALIALVVVAGALIVIAVSYGNYLIRTYTELTPRPVPHADGSPAAQEQLKARWTAFQEALDSGKDPPRMELSADDLNVFISNFPALRDRFYFQIADDRLQGQFCIPLEKTGRPKLKGRHLNGRATFNLVFEDGLVTMNVATAEANSKPIPRWILSRLQKHNLLRNLDDNLEIVQLLQKLEKIQVRGALITLTPSGAP